jgi:hypothetical protein
LGWAKGIVLLGVLMGFREGVVFLVGVRPFRYKCWLVGFDGSGALQILVGRVGNGGSRGVESKGVAGSAVEC